MYNGLPFAGIPEHVRCADSFDFTGGCADTRICATDGTSHIEEIFAVNPQARIVSSVSVSRLVDNFLDGWCNVIAGEQFDIAESILRGLGYTGDYKYGEKVHSKEQIMASVVSGGRAIPQCSHTGRSSSTPVLLLVHGPAGMPTRGSIMQNRRPAPHLLRTSTP